VIAVVGPTATGKSALAVALARALGGEVVNADASALYRGMDIGTAKPTLAERHGIPTSPARRPGRHPGGERRGIPAGGPDRPAGDRGPRTHGPILAGGSGLYVRAALDHLDIPPTDPAVRARLEAEADTLGLAALRERLTALDPVAAQRIEPNNDRRVIRALEVIELTGRPFSASLPERQHLVPTVMLGTDPGRARTSTTGSRPGPVGCGTSGLVAEVERLLDLGLERGRTARTALGYAQAIAQLRGTLTEIEANRLDRAGVPSVRPSAGVVVPARPADPLAARRRP
jgi:tRNA dimethylallyltransferase